MTVVDWQVEFEKAILPQPENTRPASFLIGLLKALDSPTPKLETRTERIFVHQARMNAGMVEHKTKNEDGFDFFEFQIPVTALIFPKALEQLAGALYGDSLQKPTLTVR